MFIIRLILLASAGGAIATASLTTLVALALHTDRFLLEWHLYLGGALLLGALISALAAFVLALFHTRPDTPGCTIFTAFLGMLFLDFDLTSLAIGNCAGWGAFALIRLAHGAQK